ncbi:hypothetical protein BGZ79_008422 [Entomortierella chlamydospora]|nr:hypothetical protein BGZ79_008422 [Entomortierella chlamydospora]
MQIEDSTLAATTIRTQTTYSSDVSYLSIEEGSSQGAEEQLREKSDTDLDDQKSPLLAKHSHITHSVNTSVEATDMAENPQEKKEKIVSETSLSKDLGFENNEQGLIHKDKPQQQQPSSHSNDDNALFATCVFDFSAQPEKSCASTVTHVPLFSSSFGKELLGEARTSQKHPTETLDQQKSVDRDEDGGYISGEDLIDSLAIGAERKRSTGERSGNGDGFCGAKKRRKGRLEHNIRPVSQTSSARSTAYMFQFLEGKLEQRSMSFSYGRNAKESNRPMNLEFDPSAVVLSWSQPPQKLGKLNKTSNRNRLRLLRPCSNDGYDSGISGCQRIHSSVDICQCRKRIFAEAIELSRPLSAGSQSADHHPGWIESIKKRKIHQYPTKWTSMLSPSPYVKLLTIRDFWDVMKLRLDASSSSKNRNIDLNHLDNNLIQGSMRNKTIRQYRCPSQFLRGLWEEELRQQREQKMIPDTIRRPPRSKVFNSKPIGFANSKPALPSLLSTSRSSTHAIAEGSDMSEYKPWKDGTVLPNEGYLDKLKDLRSNIMDPWPAEEAKSKDECTRILHRMREQLNIVINLQIHLRSMIKTAPTQWSFLLSIRHPAQVSIELLLALYGPHFMQTSNFRAIEQLLWGAKGHSQPQTHTDAS